MLTSPSLHVNSLSSLHNNTIKYSSNISAINATSRISSNKLNANEIHQYEVT